MPRACRIRPFAQRAQTRHVTRKARMSYFRQWRKSPGSRHHRYMGIILSHTTARAVYQTVHSIAHSGIEPRSDAAIFKSHPSRKLVDDALRRLAIHNVEADENAPIRDNGLRTQRHAQSYGLPNPRLDKTILAAFDSSSSPTDISIVGVELCALQAATYLPFRKLVEYYFGFVRGLFPEKTGSTTSYSERPALTTTARLKHFFNTLSACDGLIPARKAIKCVRDGPPFAHGNSLCHDAHAARKRRRPGSKGPRNRL